MFFLIPELGFLKNNMRQNTTFFALKKKTIVLRRVVKRHFLSYCRKFFMFSVSVLISQREVLYKQKKVDNNRYTNKIRTNKANSRIEEGRGLTCSHPILAYLRVREGTNKNRSMQSYIAFLHLNSKRLLNKE